MRKIVLFSTVLLLAGFLLYLFAPIGVLWERTYTRLDFFNPFHEETFINPFYTAFLIPHAWLPIELGNAINLLLNICVLALLVDKKCTGKKWLPLILAFTNPFFFDLMRVNNIEWIPVLGLLCGEFGLPLLAVKPQVFGAVAIPWLVKAIKSKDYLVWLPFVVSFVVIGAFLPHGVWFLKNPMPAIGEMWNFAPWPILIPVGLYLLYRSVIKDDTDLGALATAFLVPYAAPYSMAPYLALVAARWPKVGVLVWGASWWYFVVTLRRA